jgi:bla regulator protein BlaR1
MYNYFEDTFYQLSTFESDISNNPLNTINLENSDNNKKNDGNNLSNISLFILLNILLIIITLLYLFISVTFGRRYTLNRINAKKLKNKKVYNIIKEISVEFNIKIPKIFIYDGKPNAFVFGYPITLVISSKLIQCLSDKEFRMTMRHELTHIKNKDILIKPILQSLRILFFYNPLVHIITLKIIKERELMADSLYINSDKDKVTFIEALLKVYDNTNKIRYIPKKLNISSLVELISLRSRPDIRDRFNHMFNKTVKKSVCTLIICFILIFSNLTFVIVANGIIPKTDISKDKIDIINDDEIQIHKMIFYRFLYRYFLKYDININNLEKIDLPLPREIDSYSLYLIEIE